MIQAFVVSGDLKPSPLSTEIYLFLYTSNKTFVKTIF